MNKCIAVEATIFCLFLQSFPALSQECSTNVPNPSLSSQYVINADDTVSDLSTGLVWKRCIEGRKTIDAAFPCGDGTSQLKTWQQALTLVQELNQDLGGFAQVVTWRLPNIKELTSITEFACKDPAINLNAFPNSETLGYWSSTTQKGTPTNAWYVRSDFGGVSNNDKTSQRFYVRLVYDMN